MARCPLASLRALRACQCHPNANGNGKKKPTEQAPWASFFRFSILARLRGLFPTRLRFDLEEVALAVYHFFGDDVLAALAFVGEAVHQVQHDLFADGAEGAGASVALEGALGNVFQRAGGELDFAAFHAEELLVLLDQRVLGLGEDVDQRADVEGFEGGADGQAAYKFGDHAVFDEIFGLNLGEDVGAVAGGFDGGVFAAEADLALAQAFSDDVFEADERAAADEEDLRGVHLDVLLLGVFASALRGDVGDRAFEHFQEGLLHAFAADVASDADVVLGFADLVDLVDVDDAALGGFEIVVGVLQELEEDVLDVFADVAGLG